MQRVMNRVEPTVVSQRPIRPTFGIGLVLLGACANVLWLAAILLGGYEALQWFAG